MVEFTSQQEQATQQNRENLTRRLSAQNIDVDRIDESLTQVSKFTKRKQKEQLFLLSFLILQKGKKERETKQFTLRQLFHHIDSHISAFDDFANDTDDAPPSQRNSSMRSSQLHAHTLVNGGAAASRRSSIQPVLHSHHNSHSSNHSNSHHSQQIPHSSNTTVTAHDIEPIVIKRRPSIRGMDSMHVVLSALPPASSSSTVSSGSDNHPNDTTNTHTHHHRSSAVHTAGHTRHSSQHPPHRSILVTDLRRRMSVNFSADNSGNVTGIARSNSFGNEIKSNLAAAHRSMSHYSMQHGMHSHHNSYGGSSTGSNSVYGSQRSSLVVSPYGHSPPGAGAAVDEGSQSAPACTRRLVFRDLRRLDLQFTHLEHEPVLLVRRHCIVLSFYPITAIILADCVLLLLPPDGETTADGAVKNVGESGEYVEPFVAFIKDWSPSTDTSLVRLKELHRTTSMESLPDLSAFELCAAEGLLTIIQSYEEQELSAITRALGGIFRYYEKGVSPPVQAEKLFRDLKSHLFNLKQRVLSYKGVLVGVTEDEEQMAMMNLSFLQKKPHACSYPFSKEVLFTHEAVEELLEAYLLDFSHMQYRVSELDSSIKNMEEMYKLQLDTVENRALIADTALMILECAIVFGAYIAGVFGMNLENPNRFREQRDVFMLVFVLSFVVIAASYYATFAAFRFTRLFPRVIHKKHKENSI